MGVGLRTTSQLRPIYDEATGTCTTRLDHGGCLWGHKGRDRGRLGSGLTWWGRWHRQGTWCPLWCP
jgi:hypothetical protein